MLARKSAALLLFVAAGCAVVASRLMFAVSLRSRQLELEDKQSMLELELRKYMEMNGAYWFLFPDGLMGGAEQTLGVCSPLENIGVFAFCSGLPDTELVELKLI